MIAQTKRGIYLFLEQFDTVYDEISDEDKKAFLRSFIESIEVYPKNHPSKLLIKRINFNFPIAYKNGKEYSSIAFYNGNDDDDDNGPDGGGNGGNNGDINGGVFRALSGDCLSV